MPEDKVDYRGNWIMVLRILLMFARMGDLELVRGAIVYAVWAKPPELWPRDKRNA